VAKPRVCGRLVHTKIPNEIRGRVDVCGLESGHASDRPHRGQYTGMEWLQASRDEPPNIITHGGTTVAYSRHHEQPMRESSE
jgi:hypothetical protein